jgi:hypothetical protein
MPAAAARPPTPCAKLLATLTHAHTHRTREHHPPISRSYIIGFCYPAYMTIQTLANTEAVTKEKDTKTWLCFWLVTGTFNVFFDNVLFFMPLYNYIKGATFGAMVTLSLDTPCKIYDLLSEHVLTKIPGLINAKRQ